MLATGWTCGRRGLYHVLDSVAPGPAAGIRTAAKKSTSGKRDANERVAKQHTGYRYGSLWNSLERCADECTGTRTGTGYGMSTAFQYGYPVRVPGTWYRVDFPKTFNRTVTRTPYPSRFSVFVLFCSVC